MRKHGFAAFVALGVVGVLTAASTPLVEAITDTKRLRDAVTVTGIRKHLKAFQDIADLNQGTRVSGTLGYDASAGYVETLVKAAGYTVTRQPFTFPYFQETAEPVFARNSPTPRVYTQEEIATLTYSGSGNAIAPLQAVDIQIPPGPLPTSSTSGCEPEDFVGFTVGNIALIQRGTCTFALKAQNAQAAGASAVIVFNEGQEGRTGVIAGTLGGPTVTIPVIGTSFAIGQELYNLSRSSSVTVRATTSTVSENRITENIIAETTKGRRRPGAKVVVVGAHLDSVAEGPGINDNGSGSATILEIALQISKLNIYTPKPIRFIWFGAEESGLLGSEYYVSQLSAAQVSNIDVMLNFDMVASPNFVRFVYDGDGSETGIAGPAGSDAIEKVFTDYFSSVGLETDATEFNGRSDYGPFIAEGIGIPAGGLFSGAEGIKTQPQTAVYGGTAGVAYDACYHQACDNLNNGADEDGDNIDETSLSQLSDGAAHAVLTFATQPSLPRVQGNARTTRPTVPRFDFKGPELIR